MLFSGLPSAVCDPVAAVMRTVPVLVALALTVNVLDAPLSKVPPLHRTSPPKMVAPGLGDSAVNDAGAVRWSARPDERP